MTRKKKPEKCCKPDCFNCPYSDCRYDRLDYDDFKESNQRDYWVFEDSTGRKYHKGSDPEYRRLMQLAYNRKNQRKRDQKEYQRSYYQAHREEILKNQKEKYNSKENTLKCRKWRKKNIEKKREYDHQRYLRRKEAGEFAKRKEAV